MGKTGKVVVFKGNRQIGRFRTQKAAMTFLEKRKDFKEDASDFGLSYPKRIPRKKK